MSVESSLAGSFLWACGYWWIPPPLVTLHSKSHKGLLVRGSEVAFAWACPSGASMSLDAVMLLCGRCLCVWCAADCKVICVCARVYINIYMCVLVCVWQWSVPAESDPGVSPQACAGGEEEEEESEEGGGSTAAHLLEALRQFRMHHRGQYRSVLEESLATYHLRGESAVERAGERRRTTDDCDNQDEPASPPSPPSPPPSPAIAELEASQDEPIPKSDPSSDWPPACIPNHPLIHPIPEL